MEWGFFERIFFLVSIIAFGLVCFVLFEMIESMILYFFEKTNNSVYTIIGFIGLFIDGILYYVWNEKRKGRW